MYHVLFARKRRCQAFPSQDVEIIKPRRRRADRGNSDASERTWINPNEFLPLVISADKISRVVQVTDGRSVCKAYFDYVLNDWVGIGYPESPINEVTGWRFIDWRQEQNCMGYGA